MSEYGVGLAIGIGFGYIVGYLLNFILGGYNTKEKGGK